MNVDSCVYDLSPSVSLPPLPRVSLCAEDLCSVAYSQSSSADSDRTLCSSTGALFYPASLRQCRLKVLSGWSAATSGFSRCYISHSRAETLVLGLQSGGEGECVWD